MKIVFLGNPRKSHTHRWAYWLSTQGHDVVIIGDAEKDDSLYYGSVRVIRPRWPRIRGFVRFRVLGGEFANNRHKGRLYKPIVAAENPDIVHAHEALAYGPALADLPEYPRVLTPWGPDMEKLADPKTEAAKLVRLAVQSADVITSNAPGMEARWAALSGIAEDRFRLFPWGVNTGFFFRRSDEEQLQVRQALELPPGAPLVLSPRLANPLYRIPAIIAAWKSARAGAAPDSRLRDGLLVILRAGATDESWASIRKESVGDPSIRLVDDYQNANRMAQLYSAASAVVMIPETDLLAMSLLEAMACGALPIVADLPCYRAAVADLASSPSAVGTAIVAREPIAEGLLEAFRRWNDASETTVSSAGARNSRIAVESFAWDRSAQRLIDVYTEAIAKHRSP